MTVLKEIVHFSYFFLRQNVSLPAISTSGRAVLCFLYQRSGPYWILLPDLSCEFFWWCPNKGQGDSAENYSGLLNASIANFLRTTLRKYTFVYFWCGGYTLAKTCAHWPMNRTQVVHFLFLRLFAEFCARFAFFLRSFRATCWYNSRLILANVCRSLARDWEAAYSQLPT